VTVQSRKGSIDQEDSLLEAIQQDGVSSVAGQDVSRKERRMRGVFPNMLKWRDL